MPKVTLSAPVAWPHPHGIMRHYGDVLEVTEDELELLHSLGAVDVHEADQESAESSGDEDADGGEESEADSGDAPEPVAARTERPDMTAPIAVWREYAAHLGIKTTGMKKPEIIGAIDSLS